MPRFDQPPISQAYTATAGTTPVELFVPRHNYADEKMVLFVDESAGPVELVLDANATTGNTIPTVTAEGEDFAAGEYKLAAVRGRLRAYASSSTAITYHWTKV